MSKPIIHDFDDAMIALYNRNKIASDAYGRMPDALSAFTRVFNQTVGHEYTTTEVATRIENMRRRPSRFPLDKWGRKFPGPFIF